MSEKTKYRQHLHKMPTILKLKAAGNGWREIGLNIGMSPSGVRYMVAAHLPDFAHRCPACLQRHNGKK